MAKWEPSSSKFFKNHSWIKYAGSYSTKIWVSKDCFLNKNLELALLVMQLYSPWEILGLLTEFSDAVLKKEWNRKILIPAPLRCFLIKFYHSTVNICTLKNFGTRNSRDNPISKIKYCFHSHFFQASPGRKQAIHRAQRFPEAQWESNSL